jgi:hypothetical protein
LGVRDSAAYLKNAANNLVAKQVKWISCGAATLAPELNSR